MKTNTLILLMLILMSSCESQLGTTISGTFSNIASGNAFGDSSGDDAYNAMKKKAMSKPVSNTVTPTCNSLESLVPLTAKDSGNMSTIKDKLCTCEAWGSCDSKSCSCENLCPKDFGIFKKMSEKERESEENTLAFTNKVNKFSDGATYNGYCWGIALITERFNRMATFDAASEKKFKGPGQELLRLQEYKKIIARINNNEAVTIPGFKNLNDFSSDPEVKDLLEDSVKELWSQNAMTSQGLGMVTSSQTPPKAELNSLFDDVEFRLKNNLSPALVYNERDAKTDAHVLQVSGSGVLPQTGERYLCLKDNNNKQTLNQNCSVKMILKKDGTLIRKFGDRDTNNKGEPIAPIIIGKVAMTHSENPNTMEQVTNLHTKCAGEKGCPQNL